MRGLKLIRQKRGLSHVDLENLTGIDANSFSRYERGVVTPSVDVARKVAEALNVSVDELLNGPSDGKIQVTISYDWSKFEKGEINMDGNLFEIFLGKLGEIGIKGAGLPKTYAEKEELKRKICADIDSAFEVQIRRGAIQPA